MYNFVLSLFGGPSTPAAPHSAPTAHSLPTTDAPHTQPHTQPQTQPHTQPHTHTRRHSVALTGGIAGLTSASSSATDRPHSILTNHGRGSLDGLPPSAAHQSNTTMSSLQSMMQSSLQSTMQSSLQSAANSRDSSRRSSALSPMPAFATDPSLAHDAAFMSDSALEESLWREWLILGHMGTLQDRMEPSQAALPRFIHANPPRAVRNSASSTALSSIATASSTSSSTPTSSSTSTSAPISLSTSTSASAPALLSSASASAGISASSQLMAISSPVVPRSATGFHDRGPPSLIDGEQIHLYRELIALIANSLEIVSSLYLTNYRLCIKVHDPKLIKCDVEIPLASIRKLDGNYYTQNIHHAVKINGKDGQIWAIGFISHQSANVKEKFLHMLTAQCFKTEKPTKMQQMLFCFKSKEFFELDGIPFKDSMIFSFEKEYNRIGVPCDGWRITHVNKDYGLCRSYPNLLAIPARISDADLKLAAEYRTSGRVPVLCWMHPGNGAVLCRSSQPMAGWTGRSSAADIQLVSEIFNSSDEFYIFDARPLKNAIGNSLKGAGFENIQAYAGANVEHKKEIQLDFMSIENIHVIRKSFNAVRDLIQQNLGGSQYLSNLEATGWLNHLSYILSGTTKITRLIASRQTSTLVHCSDGWDRTSQLVSLSELLLDPYFRTIRGFICLIEKEWLGFGHKFASRSAQYRTQQETSDTREFSPIFVQWLDCVYQITRQYPCSFQFNERFLLTLCEHVYSCRFGNFLFDNERERKEFKVSEQTPSLWGYILTHEREFVNLLYSHDTMRFHADKVLIPRTNVQDLVLWLPLFKGRSPVIDNVQHRLFELSIKAEQYEQLVRQIKIGSVHLETEQPSKSEPVSQVPLVNAPDNGDNDESREIATNAQSEENDPVSGHGAVVVLEGFQDENDQVNENDEVVDGLAQEANEIVAEQVEHVSPQADEFETVDLQSPSDGLDLPTLAQHVHPADATSHEVMQHSKEDEDLSPANSDL
eukprot:TRINITY_DN2278_c0_g1_i3.p1 TRINITY_DN2278_c0_g1~~TRINITY_DN2278_c0_g1_i3.p1  ORF type:complete len:994 (+),score=195.86 TRINITY_DN2278_c0_g1_i3:147-3128(+)